MLMRADRDKLLHAEQPSRSFVAQDGIAAGRGSQGDAFLHRGVALVERHRLRL